MAWWRSSILQGVHIDEVVGGAVVTHSRDWNLAREAVLGTELAPSTPGITLMQACGTSLQAALMIAGKIASGQIESGIAVGSDTTSDAPIVVSKRLAKRLTEMAQQKSVWDKIKVFKGFSPAELVPQPPSVAEPQTGLSMGQHCELMAQEFQIPRAEQDRLAYESHKKAAEAYASGYMDDLVVPFAGVFRDNNIREDIDLDKLATLRTVFDKSGRGTLTAANSTPLTDGAAAVLLASEEWAATRTAGARLADSLSDRGEQFRRRRRPADGADDRSVQTARPHRPQAAGFRFLRDPRSLRRPGARHAEGLGRPRILPPCARQGSAARIDRSLETERERLLDCLSAIHSRPQARASWPISQSCSPSMAGAASSPFARRAAWASRLSWRAREQRKCRRRRSHQALFSSSAEFAYCGPVISVIAGPAYGGPRGKVL